MNRIKRQDRSSFLILVVLITVAACASSGGSSSSPRIITNSAPGFSLVNYKTFAYLQPLSTDRGNVRSLTSAHLIEATTRELEMSGLRFSESDPDLLINFVVSSRDTIQTRPSSTVSMHHGRGRYGTWGGYSLSMSATEVVQGTEGSVDVDVIDASRNQLVWEGAAVGRITDSTRENLRGTLDQAVSDIFARFPY
jgi:hypothetical protein